MAGTRWGGEPSCKDVAGSPAQIHPHGDRRSQAQRAALLHPAPAVGHCHPVGNPKPAIRLTHGGLPPGRQLPGLFGEAVITITKQDGRLVVFCVSLREPKALPRPGSLLRVHRPRIEKGESQRPISAHKIASAVPPHQRNTPAKSGNQQPAWSAEVITVENHEFGSHSGFWLANIMAGLGIARNDRRPIRNHRSAQRSGVVPLDGEQVEGRTMTRARLGGWPEVGVKDHCAANSVNRSPDQKSG